MKCLEHAGVYNRILPYGDRAYGRVITVINRYGVRTERKARHTDKLIVGPRLSVDPSLRCWQTTGLVCSLWTLTLSRRVHPFHSQRRETELQPPTYRNTPNGLAQPSRPKAGSTGITSRTPPNSPLKNAWRSLMLSSLPFRVQATRSRQSLSAKAASA